MLGSTRTTYNLKQADQTCLYSGDVPAPDIMERPVDEMEISGSRPVADSELLRAILDARRSKLLLEHEHPSGPVPLAPTQLYMLNREDMVGRDQINLCEFYECLEPVHSQQLELAVKRLSHRYPVLRSRFRREGRDWLQEISEQFDPRSVLGIDLSDVSEGDRTDRIESTAAELQLSLNLADGPLFRVAYFDLGEGRSGRLLVLVHHLLVDGYSFSALLEELFDTLRNIKSQQPLSEQRQSYEFQKWCDAVHAYASSNAFKTDASFWLDQPWDRTRRLQAGSSSPLVTSPKISYLDFCYDEKQTSGILAAAQRLKVHLIDLITAAAARVASDWTGSRVVSLALWENGRQPVRPGMVLSRQIGCFAYYWPFTFDTTAVASDQDLILAMQQRRIQGPARFGFKLARFSGQDSQFARDFKFIPIPELHINFKGYYRSSKVLGRGFKRAPEHYGSLRDPSNWSFFRIVGINAYVRDRELRINWSFSNAVYRPDEIVEPATRYFNLLLTIAGQL